jgi:hypothetical protein
MAKHSGKFTTGPSPDPTIKQRVRRALTDVDAKLRKILAEQITPETKEAVAEIVGQFKADRDDPPALVPMPGSTPPPPDPALTQTPTATTASASKTPRRPRRGEQTTRTKRVLRARVFPPDGKVPRGLTDKAVTEKVAAALAAERGEGLAPENEDGWSDPADDVVGRVIKDLGRSND